MRFALFATAAITSLAGLITACGPDAATPAAKTAEVPLQVRSPVDVAAIKAGRLCLEGINKVIYDQAADVLIDSEVPTSPIKTSTVILLQRQGNDAIQVYYQIADGDMAEAVFDAARLFTALVGDGGSLEGELFSFIGQPAVSCAQAQLSYEQHVGKQPEKGLRIKFNRNVAPRLKIPAPDDHALRQQQQPQQQQPPQQQLLQLLQQQQQQRQHLLQQQQKQLQQQQQQQLELQQQQQRQLQQQLQQQQRQRQ
jgi:hypothetical protein